MPKNIVLLSDGTGNSAGKLSKTNVWRLYQALDLSLPDPTKPSKREQIAYYDDGVGTSAFWPLAILGGAFGWGLKRNVLDLYIFLCWNYQPNDRIYCFGFSRGAFTIRVLTGLIDSQGLVHTTTKAELRQLAKEAFRRYRRSYKGGFLLLDWLLKFFRARRDNVVCIIKKITKQSSPIATNLGTPPIAFLGLWDSVAAYGLPIDELTRAWDSIFPLSVPDRNLRKNIERACHAPALDDERHTFHPVLWNEESLSGQNHAKHIEKERLSQVWFAGMHSNVGGGYPDDALSNVPLDWIMKEAERDCLLRFKADDRKRVKETADICGKLYDSRHGLGGTYRYQPRKLKTLTNDKNDEKNKVVIERPKIHESVFVRIQRGIDGYAPLVLPSHYAVVADDGDILDLGTTPPSGKPYFVEHATQAESRANRQEEVWNLVWWKRFFYFISIIWVLALAAFPLYLPETLALESEFSSLSWVISSIGMFLPTFVNSWLKVYQSNPGIFFLFVLFLIMLVYIGSRLQRQIFDKMRAIWRPIAQRPGSQVAPVAALPDDRLYCLRSHWLYQRFFGLMKWKVLPFIVGLVAFLMIVEGVSHQLFAVMSSFGCVCTPTGPAHLMRGKLEKGTFPANALCWASGVELEQGRRYQLTITIDNKEQWRDGDKIKPGIGGFGPEQTKVVYLGLLTRRYIMEPWFKPVARIGSQGSDEYPLSPMDGSVPNEKTEKLVAEITARRKGELFLFVNDGVLPVPNKWQVFYNNNYGTATVTVQPVPTLTG